MSLPAPNLDDRRFQELVDDAKRMVQARCPEWTDHNVSDPGVTLIETFAFMTDQLMYRLNRVPDRLYIKFLELIGVRLLPPTPARAPLTFWLSTAADERMTIPIGTRAATSRTELEEPIIFATVEPIEIVPCQLQDLLTQAADSDDLETKYQGLTVGNAFPAFNAVPVPGDSLVFALSDPVPSCVVQLSLRCHVEGVGVDPTWPPLTWEARDGDGAWTECPVDHDDTGGFNKSGEVVLHVPRTHAASVIDGQRGGWLRARVTEAEEGQPPYSAAPIIEGATAATIGGTADAAHAEVVEFEGIGISEGVPGQAFTVIRIPILAGGGPAIVEVGTDDGWQEWIEVENFAASSPDDLHYILDAVNGEVRFGPLVRVVAGGFRQYGAVPDKGAPIRMRCYTTGGGRRGNVPKGAIRTLKSAIPFVAGVSNREAAQGGVDGEDIESAKTRGPIMLHRAARAVTAEDFEQLTRQAAPEIARVRCLAAGEGTDAGTVRVLDRSRGGQRTGCHPLRRSRPERRDDATHRRNARRDAPGGHPRVGRTTVVPRGDGRGDGARPPEGQRGAGARRSRRGAQPVPQPARRRARRQRLAVGSSVAGRRGVLGTAGDSRRRAHRGRADLRREPGDGGARATSHPARARAEQPRVLVRTPSTSRTSMTVTLNGQGSPTPTRACECRARSSSCCPACSKKTSSRAGSRPDSTR